MKTRRIWLILALCLLGAGVVLCIVAFTRLNFRFQDLRVASYIINEHVIEEDFSDISIQGDIEDIEFVPARDKDCTVLCYEDEKHLHSVHVEEGTLFIDQQKPGRWQLGFFQDNPQITIALPEKTYGNLSVETETGDIRIPNLRFSNIALKLSTGELKLSAQTAGMIQIKTDTGDMLLKNCLADSLYAETDTGDVVFDQSDANEIHVKTDTGDVSGSLLTAKVFTAITDTGDVDVPAETSGGICEIQTDTGDIRISIAD
ncbi:MAG: DUF4097 family beta strand repeat protein [Lachnospiraceae bacterium]|nr:DUF4097 family beta strand repeat protein [Lachnospiraceae bacterium]